MLKLLRQLRGDSRDVAQLRAETFDEIRDIDSLFSDGSAKHALSAESSVTTTLKNITSGDVLAQIKADMVSTVAIEKVYNVGSSCTNIPAPGCFFIKAKGDHVNMRLDAFGYGTSKQTYWIYLKDDVWDNDGTNPKWTKVIADSGFSLDDLFAKKLKEHATVPVTSFYFCFDPAGNIYTTANTRNIYKSTDGGVTWVALNPGAKNWFGICSNASGALFVAARGDGVYKSTDGGVTWTNCNIATGDWIDICCDPAGNIYVAQGSTGSSSYIYKSTDGGVTWVALTKTFNQLRSICCDPSGNVYATEYEGDIYKSADGGVTFNALGKTFNYWGDICCDAFGNVYVIAFDTTTAQPLDIYKSTDGGTNFVATGAGVFNALAFSPAGNLHALYDAKLYKTEYVNKTSKIGQLYVGLESTPNGVLLFQGALKSRSVYPEIASMITSGHLPSVTDAAWLAGNVGAFSTGDGSSTFRLPDWRGLFPRGAGINSVLAMANTKKYTGGSLAAVMLDMMQGHRHSLSISDYGAVSVYSYGRGYPLSAVLTDAVGSPISDGTNGTPRVGAETRPASVSVNFGIYFE